MQNYPVTPSSTTIADINGDHQVDIDESLSETDILEPGILVHIADCISTDNVIHWSSREWGSGVMP